MDLITKNILDAYGMIACHNYREQVPDINGEKHEALIASFDRQD